MSTITSNFLNGEKLYKGICGWVLNFFGKAIRVITENDKIRYLHIDKYMQRLFSKVGFNSTSTERRGLSRKFIELLHPVKRTNLKATKIKEITTLFIEKCQTSKIGPEETQSKLEELKTRHLKVMNIDDNKFKDELEIGDIIFKKNPDNTKHIVVRAQKIFSNFTKAKAIDREGYKYSHVAIYLGEGQVAEAVADYTCGSQIRILDIDDIRFKSLPGDYAFTVTRSEDKKLAKQAADIARSIAKKAAPAHEIHPNTHMHKYAFSHAARSLILSSSFGPIAKQRYFKQYIDHRSKRPPQRFSSPRNFYCSNFVAYCYQTAEGRTVAQKILGEKSKPRQGKSIFQNALNRGVWARLKALKYYLQLNQEVKLKYDTKWFNPQDFRNFIVGNPTIFKDTMHIKGKSS